MWLITSTHKARRRRSCLLRLSLWLITSTHKARRRRSCLLRLLLLGINFSTMRLPLHVLSDYLRTLILSHWLDVRSLAMLDVAVSSKSLRPYWMTLLGSLRSTSIDEMNHSALSLMWLIERGICADEGQRLARTCM